MNKFEYLELIKKSEWRQSLYCYISKRSNSTVTVKNFLSPTNIYEL